MGLHYALFWIIPDGSGLCIFDIICVVLITGYASYETGTAIYKWYYWTKIGKIPFIKH